MKMRNQSKVTVVWILVMSLCLSPFFSFGDVAQAAVGSEIEEAGQTERGVTVGNPIIDAEEGQIIWDCVEFGNYWQSEYITSPENRPEEAEDDVVHEDTDGTRYLVRSDKKCYKQEPIKWRVLSVSEDGMDAFLMADKNLDAMSYYSEYSDVVTWENSDIRTWLNEDFLKAAFTDEEKEGILDTEIVNLKSPEYEKEEGEEEEVSTTDKIWLPSREEVTTRAYGFTDNTGGTDTRKVKNTDFAGNGGTIKAEDVSANYWLRTMSTKDRVSHVEYMDGSIPTENVNVLLGTVNEICRVRPVLHLDLTKTELWKYAGRVKQDQTEISPDAVASTAVPAQTPESRPGVTMAPGQIYPKNPVVNQNDMAQNTWDCIYFGKYYGTKITPSVLAEADQHDSVAEDGEEVYLVRHEQGYFRYEPIKWRVLSINEDGTDAFLMADQVLDMAAYYSDSNVQITWEKSDIRQWLNGDFMEKAFTSDEQAAVETTDVTTSNNPWSGEAGGNATKDKVYLASIKEMSNPAYGFSSDVAEGNTRKITVTDYTQKGGTPNQRVDGFLSYWLRSPGTEKGCPAQVGHWGEGEILTEASVMLEKAAAYLGVRPVLHVDLSDTSLWTYAGQVTPSGVVTPKEEISEKPEEPILPYAPVQDQSSAYSAAPTATPTAVSQRRKVTKPGKPTIKKLKNKKGKKVTLTLSKKVSGAAGYQVAYARKASMKGQRKKFFKGTSITVKGLKKKKTYYFQVRAYQIENGKKVYGNWGSKKKVKVKK